MQAGRHLAGDWAVSIVSSVNDVYAAEAGPLAKAEAAELLAALGAVRRVARRAVRGSAEAQALPPARSELLRLAARRPGIGVAEAAQELRLAPNSVSTMVSKLANDGLLNRGRAEADGRSVRLTVTDAGAARVEQWKDIRAELAGWALDRLTPADRRAIRAAVPALGRLAEQMEELLSTAPRDRSYRPGSRIADGVRLNPASPRGIRTLRLGIVRFMAPMDGRFIAGRYILEEPIGHGGMGVVWRAHDRVLNRKVAVKEVMLPAAMGDDDAAAYQRALREAQTVARLNHPNIVTVHDVAEEGGRLWIVMELIPSGSLDQRIAAYGPLTPLRTARLGQQLLSALAAVHAAGVLHRDVKPNNVLIAVGDSGDGPQERAVLTDFGIAQAEGDVRMTQANVVMGSAGYTAPERLAGHDATPASDLWSLGATLYAAVEGHGPYQRDSRTGTLAATADEAPPAAPSAGRLAPLIEALLRRDLAARPTAAVAAHILSEIVRRLPEETAPASFVAANWLDLTPAESALPEISEPAPWAGREPYAAPLPDAPSQESSTPPPNPTADTVHDLLQEFNLAPAEDFRPGARRAGPVRRRGAVVRVAVAVLVLAGIGVGGWLLAQHRVLNDQPQTNSAATRSPSKGTTTATATRPASPAATVLPTQTSGTSVVTAINSHSDALPPGYKIDSHSAASMGTAAGFSIGLPPGWQDSGPMARYVTLTGPGGKTYVEIDLTRHVKSDMVAEARYLERTNFYSGTSQLLIHSEPILGTSGAIWRFDWVRNGTQMRMDVLLFNLGSQSYTIYANGPAGAGDDEWNHVILPTVMHMLSTFTSIR
jgi:eukaryotic-like serine/threonine-protein kinase